MRGRAILHRAGPLRSPRSPEKKDGTLDAADKQNNRKIENMRMSRRTATVAVLWMVGAMGAEIAVGKRKEYRAEREEREKTAERVLELQDRIENKMKQYGMKACATYTFGAQKLLICIHLPEHVPGVRHYDDPAGYEQDSYLCFIQDVLKEENIVVMRMFAEPQIQEVRTRKTSDGLVDIECIDDEVRKLRNDGVIACVSAGGEAGFRDNAFNVAWHDEGSVHERWTGKRLRCRSPFSFAKESICK